MNLDTILGWANVVVSGAVTVILIPLGVYFIRYYWDRRRWHVFNQLVRDWVRDNMALPEDLTDQDWKALTAILLWDAGFEPARIHELNDLAVSYAKGLAGIETRGRI